MKNLSFGLLAMMATGCATVKPFEQSDEAMMSQVMEEARISKDLDSWIKNAGSAKVVFINMEDNNYTDDQNPEYMIVDHLYTKIKDGNNSLKILERDPDILNVFQKEIDGVDLPATWKPGGTTDDSLTIDERRAELGAMIRAVVTEISPQDVLAQLEEECCKADSGSKDLEKIIANEVGSNKSSLLKWLVGEYYDLYPEVKANTRHVDVDNADYLIAYRVYDYGTWKARRLTDIKRYSYVKLHVRVVDMETGEVIVADFMDNQIEDTLSNKEAAALAKSNASQSDYGRPSSRSSRSGKDASTRKRSTSSFGTPSSSKSGGLISTVLEKIMFWK